MAATSELTDAPGAHKKNLKNPNEPEDHALGRSRGGFGTKIHLVCDKKGNPIAVDASGGQAHESQYFESTLEKVSIPQERGRPRAKPDKVAGDKAYSSNKIRDWLEEKDIGDVIPTKDNEERRPDFNKRAYRQRNIVERCIGWLKEFRRVATRYEKLAVNFLGMVKLAMILRYL